MRRKMKFKKQRIVKKSKPEKKSINKIAKGTCSEWTRGPLCDGGNEPWGDTTITSESALIYKYNLEALEKICRHAMQNGIMNFSWIFSWNAADEIRAYEHETLRKDSFYSSIKLLVSWVSSSSISRTMWDMVG